MSTKFKLKKDQLFAILGVIVIVCALVVLMIMALESITFPGSHRDDDKHSATVGSSSESTEPTEPPTPEANPFHPADFSYDAHGYLTCNVGPSMLGVDVSEWQGQIDWEQVRQAGVEFAIIRVGGRYTNGDGEIFKDKYFQQNMEGALAAGLKVGVYFFSQALNVEEALEEAQVTLDWIRNYQLDMPVVFDWEDEQNRTAGIDPAVVTECAKAFCDAIAAHGYETMIYFNPHHGTYLLNLLELEDYPFWLAMYNDAMDYPYHVEMWQYTCTGTVPGITGGVDLNLLLPDIRTEEKAE